MPILKHSLLPISLISKIIRTMATGIIHGLNVKPIRIKANERYRTQTAVFLLLSLLVNLKNDKPRQRKAKSVPSLDYCAENSNATY